MFIITAKYEQTIPLSYDEDGILGEAEDSSTISCGFESLLWKPYLAHHSIILKIGFKNLLETLTWHCCM